MYLVHIYVFFVFPGNNTPSFHLYQVQNSYSHIHESYSRILTRLKSDSLTELDPFPVYKSNFRTLIFYSPGYKCVFAKIESAEINLANSAIMMCIRDAEPAINSTFGRACPLHARCMHLHAVEPHRIGSCDIL